MIHSLFVIFFYCLVFREKKLHMMEWQRRTDVAAANPNLRNTLTLSKKYRVDIRRHNIEITQNLSESTIGLDIPCYLL